MLFDTMSRSSGRKEFNHRPLKKRPVLSSSDDVRLESAPPTPAQITTQCDEPENLSTKPEDLSRTGNYPSAASSPPSSPRRWPEPSSPPLCIPHYQPPTFPHLVAPIPSYMPRLAQYPHEQPWARTSPVYPTACLPFAYAPPEAYSGLSPRAACSPPALSPNMVYQQQQHHPYQPIHHNTERPKDMSSPVSVDSGISTESSSVVPRRNRRDPSAPRYQCTDCGKSYSTYSGLTKHRQFHCAAAEGNLAKKSFSCKYCPKVYTSLGALKMHIRTHTLPCKCHLCGKAFSRPWLLQGHIRTHTGEKPFSCHHCRRAFADRSNLRAHLQTHSEVKKYSCASCSKTFSRMSLLSKHLEGGCPGCGPINPHFEYNRVEEMAY